MDELETAIITRTGPVFEVADVFGDILGTFTDWNQLGDMYLRRGFSEAYISKRKAALEYSAGTSSEERKP